MNEKRCEFKRIEIHKHRGHEGDAELHRENIYFVKLRVFFVDFVQVDFRIVIRYKLFVISSGWQHHICSDMLSLLSQQCQQLVVLLSQVIEFFF